MQKSTNDVSVIIPFKDKAAMTIDCLQSLKTHWPEIKEVVLVSNNSKAEEVAKIQAFCDKNPKYRLLIYDKPFNYQKLNNWAVSQINGAYVMFLNNDTELVDSSKAVLDNMLAKAGQPDVGITGCLLLYGDHVTIQHAGVFLYPRGTADHMYVGKKLKTALKESGSKQFPYDITKDIPMTAVTGAVNIIERRKFDAVGGFDEAFIVCGGDVDLCIRLNKANYQTWFVSGGHIIHKESQSREQKPIAYNDFYCSYKSYINGYDPAVGDPYLPLLTKDMI